MTAISSKYYFSLQVNYLWIVIRKELLNAISHVTPGTNVCLCSFILINLKIETTSHKHRDMPVSKAEKTRLDLLQVLQQSMEMLRFHFWMLHELFLHLLQYNGQSEIKARASMHVLPILTCTKLK